MSPQAQREAVLVMQVEVELSQRRACGLMELDRATCRYRKRRSEDQPLRVRLRELAEARRRFGYRQLQTLLEREGGQVNHKRVHRLYVEEKLSLRLRPAPTLAGQSFMRPCRCKAEAGRMFHGGGID